MDTTKVSNIFMSLINNKRELVFKKQPRIVITLRRWEM